MLKVAQRKEQPPRIVIYGPEGIGKTTFGAESENPVFLCTEDGATNVPVDKIEIEDGREKVMTFDEVMTAVKSVATEPHDYKTLVLDTINYAVGMAAAKVCSEKFGGDWIKFHAFGGNQGWGATVEEIRPLINSLDACRSRGMTVILLAHDGTQSVRNPVQGDYHRFAGDMDKRPWNLIAQWADVVGHAQYEHTVIDVNKQTKKGRAVGSTTRIVRFGGTAAEAAKCRVGFELPDELPLSYPMFRANLGRDTYTLDLVRDLWGLLPSDQVPRVLAWLGCPKLEDAPVFKLRQLLTRLQSLMTQTDEIKEDSNAA